MVVLYEINELKSAEAELLQLHRRRQLAQSLTLSASFDLDLERDVMDWSENTESLLGLPENSLAHTHKAFMRSVHPEDRLRLDACLDAAMKDGQPFTTSYRVVWPDGSEHMMEQRGALLKDVDGKPTHLLGVIRILDRL